LKLLQKFIRSADAELASILVLLLYCGARVGKDIKFLKSDKVIFERTKILAQYGLRKNAKRSADRRTQIINTRDLYTELIPQKVITWWNSQYLSGIAEPFSHWSATKVNQALAAIATKHQWPRPTTYSFRNIFVETAIAACDRDFELAARRFTLHHNSSILKAHYDCL
jgi:hypothetical protein